MFSSLELILIILTFYPLMCCFEVGFFCLFLWGLWEVCSGLVFFFLC